MHGTCPFTQVPISLGDCIIVEDIERSIPYDQYTATIESYRAGLLNSHHPMMQGKVGDKMIDPDKYECQS